MEFLNVLAAALGSWLFGAVWYMVLSKPWMEASGVAVDAGGKPAEKSPMPFIISGISAILVAGMMRHVFVTSNVVTLWEGVVSGFGIGLFFISAWMMMNYTFAGRPFKLTLIDGGYAVCGCTIMGAILTLF